MKKFILLFVLILTLTGCSTMSNKEISRCIRDIENSPRSEEITIEGTYKEVFQATVEVFHNLCIQILEKDFDNKRIFGINYVVKEFLTSNAGSDRYIISFEPNLKNNEVKITIKSIPLVRYHFTTEFILQKIQEEIELQRKLK